MVNWVVLGFLALLISSTIGTLPDLSPEECQKKWERCVNSLQTFAGANSTCDGIIYAKWNCTGRSGSVDMDTFNVSLSWRKWVGPSGRSLGRIGEKIQINVTQEGSGLNATHRHHGEELHHEPLVPVVDYFYEEGTKGPGTLTTLGAVATEQAITTQRITTEMTTLAPKEAVDPKYIVHDPSNYRPIQYKNSEEEGNEGVVGGVGDFGSGDGSGDGLDGEGKFVLEE